VNDATLVVLVACARLPIESMTTASSIRTCPCCGLAQTLPNIPPRMKAECSRCGTALHRPGASLRSNNRTAAVALAALVLYPIAITQPILQVQSLGHRTESSILDGTVKLLANGQLVVGVIILLCSVVIPLTKLISLLVLSLGGLGLRKHHRAWTYRLIEWTGRWGMLDVLLVAILVAVLKLGDTMVVTPGPAAAAFTMCVVLSLLATACFDPHSLWENDA
jgi:paraquat-inducible protein A